MRKILATSAVLALSAFPARALRVETMPAALANGQAQRMEVASGQALIQFTLGTSSAAHAQALLGLGCRVLAELPNGWTLVGLPAGMAVPAGLLLLKGASGALNIAPDHVYRPTLSPNDPLVPDQWALNNIDAFRGWGVCANCTGQGSQIVTLAMLDAGIDSTNPDLAAKVSTTSGNMFFDPDNNGSQSADNPPTPACYHATATSGVAAASTNNGIGIAGISWGARLLSLRVFNAADCNLSDCSDTGAHNGCGTDDAAIINAVNYAVSQENSAAYGKIVLNMSIGSAGTCATADQTAMDNAVAHGIPVVVSAGNDAGAVNQPADCAGTTGGSGIIPVGATTQNNTVATSADWGAGNGSSNGPELAANGVVAPGTNIETTGLGNSYSSGNNGTSFAAPHVAGLAALLLSAEPTASAVQIQSWIRNTAQNIGADANHQGAGLIDLYVALSSATTGAAPSATSVGGPNVFAYPNPFRITSQTLVFFSLPSNLQTASPVIKIYTVNGQLVATLSSLTWNGRNAAGNLVASGTYLFDVSSSAGHAVGRMAVIR